MKIYDLRLLMALAALGVTLRVLSQPVPPTTAYTRNWLASTNQAQAQERLGVTANITTASNGLSDRVIATNAALDAKIISSTNLVAQRLAAGSYPIAPGNIGGTLTNNTTGRATNAYGRATQTFTNYFNTHALTVPSVVSNVFINNKGGVLRVTNTLAAPGLKLVNSSIENATITNIAYVEGGTALALIVTEPEFPDEISLENISVYGDHYGFRFLPTVPAQGIVNVAENCRFYARKEAVEIWDGFWEFRKCVFDAGNTIKPSGASSCIAFASNDDSTNVLTGCKFIYSGGSGTTESVGFVGWAMSDTTFYDCSFVSKSNTALQTAIYSSEPGAMMTFNRCTFDLHGGLLLYVDEETGSGSVTNNVITFNDCYLNPFTNGVVVRNASLTNYVRGGNLVLENFERPERVVFLDRFNVTQPTFGVGVNYTNTGFASLNWVSFVATANAIATDYLQYDLFVDLDGNNAWDYTNSVIGADSTTAATPIACCNFVFPLNVGSVWRIETNGISVTGSVTIERKMWWRTRLP